MNILSKIFYIIFWSIVFSSVSVSAFNQKLLAILNASNLKPESQRLIAYNFDGTKVVSNNHKKREGQVVNAQPKNNEQPKNSIKKIFEENDGTLNVVVELVDDKSEVKISVFNMLGKEVKKIYQGLPSEKNDDGYYVFDSQTPLNLPKNVYILVVQGNTFKIADRFIIAR